MTQGSNDGGPVDRAHTPGLLPCPFCGNAFPAVGYDSDMRALERRDCITARCRNCGSETRKFSSALEAANEWNRRAPTSPDLLAVAESVVAWADQLSEFLGGLNPAPFIEPPFVATARAAIAKAKGVQK